VTVPHSTELGKPPRRVTHYEGGSVLNLPVIHDGGCILGTVNRLN
jgi:hypothetical protein